jgi:hypothetical protein
MLLRHKIRLSMTDRYVLQNPERYKEAKNLPELAVLAQVENILVVHIEFIVRVLERLEVLAHTSLANNIKSRARTPFGNLNCAGGVYGSICGRLLGILTSSVVRLRRGHGRCGRFPQTLDQLAGLRPKDRIQFLDVSESKSRHESLPLLLVLVAFGKQDANA